MKKLILIASAILVFGLMPFAAGAAPNVQEGEWEMTMKMEMKGMPPQMAAQMSRPMTHAYCLTKKDMVPQNPDKNKDCKIIDQKISGNTVTWEMVCKDKDGESRSKGKITYKGNSYDGEMKATMTGKGSKPMEVNYKMKGKRLEPCKN